jgi:hypothetical protein
LAELGASLFKFQTVTSLISQENKILERLAFTLCTVARTALKMPRVGPSHG